MDYKQFRENYLTTHRASIPVKPRGSNSWFAIMLWVLVYIGAAVISGVHTVPTIVDSIPKDVLPPIAGIASLFGFLFLELALFTGALSRVKSRLKSLALSVAFIAAVVANVYSAVKAFTETQSDGFAVVVGVILGVAAPLMALVAGETVAHLRSENESDTAEDMKTYRQEMRDLDAKINAAYTRHMSDKVEPIEITREEKPQLPTGNLRGKREIYETLQQYPDVVEQLLQKQINAREVAERLNTSPATLSKVLATFRKERETLP